jgi:DNA repair protein RadC
MATADCTARLEREDRAISRALRILEKRAKYDRPVMDSPMAVRAYLRLRLDGLEHEEFWCVWLDAQHRIIEAE